MVMSIWSADTLFWQLSIDHNMDAYYQVKYWLQAFHIGFPVARTDGRTDVRSPDDQNFLAG